MRTAPQQLPPISIDSLGFSVFTQARSDIHPAPGACWNPVSFAAAAPVYVHPLTGGRSLMVHARRWYGATNSTHHPGGYTAYTEDTTPGWAVVTTPAGTVHPTRGVNGWSMPTYTAGTRTLVGATGRATDYLYFLHTGGTDGVVTMCNTHPPNAHAIIGEETCPPPSSGVNMNMGIWVDGAHLVCAGTDSSHNVYLMRKPWHAVGANTNPIAASVRAREDYRSNTDWEYFDGVGHWSSAASDCAPFQTYSGNLTSVGPITFARIRGRSVLATVNVASTVYTGQFWYRPTPGSPWTAQPGSVALGTGAAYLGHGVRLCPGLTSLNSIDAVPYCASVKVTNGDSSYTLANNWGSCPI